MIDLSPEQLHIVKKMLASFVPNHEVWAFGSRVKGTAKKHSDLDLVIIDKKPLGFSKLYDLKEAFAESDLPFRIDIVDWSAISDDFKKIIQTQYEILQTSKH